MFAHDQQTILDADRSRKFGALPGLRYVFLGGRDVDKISGRGDVIIARDLEHNIERYPRFCSFTGWYALWRNNLIESDHVHLLEYDIVVKNSFNEAVSDWIRAGHDFMGYVPMPMKMLCDDDPKYLSGMVESIHRHHGVDILGIVRSAVGLNGSESWSATSNSTFKRGAFNEYMEWFSPLIDDIKDDRMCGHAHERSISFFCLMRKKKMFLTRAGIRHMMMNSHRS